MFTLDLYGERNFPFEKAPCDLGIPLPDGTQDEEYLTRLAEALRVALRLSGPDLAIYVSGADPFVGDRLGRLALTRDGLARRDRLVFDALGRAGVPVATTMAGGYAADVRDTVAIHGETVRAAVV